MQCILLKITGLNEQNMLCMKILFSLEDCPKAVSPFFRSYVGSLSTYLVQPLHWFSICYHCVYSYHL